ncbi:DUF2130 domain-containing protein [Haoranjiania flava]|uniref:DUF2130 domain-containing protein n=1 Tax=Haoranjiania flava TaxID=1856322 RepID=A0AAE3LJA4_9BACT|nr:DUF2130 domain-containing protein [Haoranjiania flava]MCU7693507.1 DUF2130 domain-containing protein [Haoranjiania flava]
MPKKIKCPTCAFEFPLEDALKDEVKDLLEKEKQTYREEMMKFKQRKEEEFKQKEKAYRDMEEALKKQAEKQQESFEKMLKEELTKQQEKQREELRKEFFADYEHKIKMLEVTAREQEEKLKESRKKELDFLHKEKALKIKEAELELLVQRQLLQERELLKEQLQKEELEKNALKDEQHNLQIKELKKQLEDQKKLAEEMKRKAEQGSMQLQGEVQELELEEILRTTFPFDRVEEIGKGVVGADCVLVVRNQFGQEAGKIIFESKRTKAFANEWVEKLKADMRSLNADIGLIVTQVLPKDMERFGERDGVYICTFAEVRSVVLLLRSGILKVADARKSQENKGDKMVMLYDYLTGNEFVQQWKAIREGFMAMKINIQKERDAMERIWKQREKQLEKVLLNATHIRGSIEGIAGSDTVDMRLLEDADELFLE